MPEEVYSVSDITADIRGSLEDQFTGIWVEGEISNHRLPASGHHYFTLKDSFAQLSCVLFRGSASKLSVPVKDGMQVQVFGNISVYEARGQYQLIAQLLQPKGAGDLQAKFEELKRKLDAEGLFDPSWKKAIPAFPRTIGIVTSPTGAAIRDILHVFARRAPWIRILIQPARVQGEGSAAEIAYGIKLLETSEQIPRPDLILVSRGGGSIEDLWSFNEEIVARAIAECSIPVMSGVGHEIDFTIADFVADRREPTPSAAAENATPDAEALLRHLSMLQDSLDSRLGNSIVHLQRSVLSLKRELDAREPGRRIQSWVQSLDFLGERLENALESRLVEARAEWQSAGRVLDSIRPEREVSRVRERLNYCHEKVSDVAERKLQESRHILDSVGSLLHSLSPEATVKRGFSMTLDEIGNPVTSISAVKSGDRLITKLVDGEIESVVDQTG
ncbi:MAG: exodeoxyribonuclease VII large subunit [Verrucomicrobiales bacterium]|nr:exodeoxyribonuclease VII large subunit [Verrucomicrobiales bacterium]